MTAYPFGRRGILTFFPEVIEVSRPDKSFSLPKAHTLRSGHHERCILAIPRFPKYKKTEAEYMSKITALNVNGKELKVDVDSATSLLEVLRNDLDLTGSKYGCGQGEC